ncbi:DUF1627 domain-containing protein [Salmonella enterica subsp. enterica serovar 4,5,12:b:-]|nr:DUF1627 domain-containing protein [Salmonella enterica subsp. enterica serovar 4,5,12:b:-]
MESVLDALKAMGKASSQEVAARLGVTRDEAVSELWKIKRRGEADNRGSMWWLTGKAKNAVNEPVSVFSVDHVEVGSGSEENATAVERNRFSLTENTARGADTAEVVQTIPSFTEKRPDDFISRSLRRANRELRRKDGEVAKMRQVCAALRVLNRHRDIVQGIFPEG